jgi:hypothetical protein
MEEPFVIEVNYKGVERAFEARLQVFGYSHRFHVDVEGVEVLFERDEEGSYRAMAPQLPENAPEGMERGTAGRSSGFWRRGGVGDARRWPLVYAFCVGKRTREDATDLRSASAGGCFF